MDIANLTYEELAELNLKIVKRLNELNKEKTLNELRIFEIGEIVVFKNDEGKELRGRVVRINQKTLSVKTEEGIWYVYPSKAKKIDI
mgnify:CR=1 FL=1